MGANEVPALKLIFPGYVDPEEGFIAEYQKHVTDLSGLAPHGINLEHIQDMLRQLHSWPALCLPVALSHGTVLSLVHELSFSRAQQNEGKLIATIVFVADRLPSDAQATIVY